MGEQTALARIANRLCEAQGRLFPDGLERLQSAELAAAGRDYLDTVAPRDSTATRFTDTTPMNFRLLGLAAWMFPDARFVVCLRDPRDNCLSLFRQMLTGANDFTHRLEHLGAYYRLHRALVQHWREALGERLHVLEYERLVGDTEAEVRRLLAFCGLPFDRDCLQFHRSKRHVNSPSAAQVRQPIYSKSVGAWKRYRKHLAPLVAALEG